MLAPWQNPKNKTNEFFSGESHYSLAQLKGGSSRVVEIKVTQQVNCGLNVALHRVPLSAFGLTPLLGKIHHYLQVWFQLLTMWWTLESNYYITYFLPGRPKPSRVNPVTQMHKIRTMTKQEQHLWVEEKVSTTGMSGSGLGTVIKVRHSPVIAQWGLSDETAPAGQAASGFGSRFKSGSQSSVQIQMQNNMGKIILNPQLNSKYPGKAGVGPHF